MEVINYGGQPNIDWSKNLYTEINEYPNEIIQALWVEDPKEEPYVDEKGNIIIDRNDIYGFLNLLAEYLKEK